MVLKLTEEMRKALEARPGEPLPLEDEVTGRMYVLVEQEVYDSAMAALAWQHEGDMEAIRQGLADMHAGRVHTFEEVDARLREKHGFPPRT